MAFTLVTVTHTFTTASGSPASGTVEFSLSKRMTNSGVSIMPGAPVTATLDENGALSQQLAANTDTDTNPMDAQWRVDIRIGPEDDGPYWIVVPSTSSTVDLGALLPTHPQAG